MPLLRGRLDPKDDVLRTGDKLKTQRLKRKSKPDKGKVDAANIIDAERTKTIEWQLPDYDEPVPEPPEKRVMKSEQDQGKGRSG